MEHATMPQRVLVMVTTEKGIVTADGLVLGHEVWLVPAWQLSPDERWQWPARAIRVDLLGCQPMAFAGHQFRLVPPLPTAVLAGQSTQAATGEPLQVVEGDTLRAWRVPVQRIN